MHTNTSHHEEFDTFCIGTFFRIFFPRAYLDLTTAFFCVLSFKSGKCVGISEKKSYQNKEKATHLYSKTRRHGSYMPFTCGWLSQKEFMLILLFCSLERWNKGKHNEYNGCQCARSFQYFQLDTPWIFCGDFSPHTRTHTLNPWENENGSRNCGRFAHFRRIVQVSSKRRGIDIYSGSPNLNLNSFIQLDCIAYSIQWQGKFQITLDFMGYGF